MAALRACDVTVTSHPLVPVQRVMFDVETVVFAAGRAQSTPSSLSRCWTTVTTQRTRPTGPPTPPCSRTTRRRSGTPSWKDWRSTSQYTSTVCILKTNKFLGSVGASQVLRATCLSLSSFASLNLHPWCY